jgi:hypothetical protein
MSARTLIENSVCSKVVTGCRQLRGERMIRTLLLALAMLAAAAAPPLAAAVAGGTDAATVHRTRVTIYPRRAEPGPNAVRHCESWLQRENRPSGPVLTPQMRCEWR